MPISRAPIGWWIASSREYRHGRPPTCEPCSRVDELSPGERTRAGLALLQACGTNVLVLDEPTNHLDLAAIEQLEQALETYDGALLLVTHDRRMLQNVRLDRTWAVDNGCVTER
ncbi:Putative ABC transporter, ATP-binding protein [Mycobacteroides abscessus subsp. abscessus]|nr:Putative ABC transporter, ATP-binding protein [Mycobacteroides abscessus subsp. abscessus]